MNSEELNQRINQHFMSDGLLEILFGLLVLFGTLVFVNVYQNDLYPILGQLFFGAAVIVALGPGLRFLKKQFTHPRIGYFKQKHSQETKQQSYAIYMVGLVAIAFIFFMTIVMGLLLTADNVNFQHMADFMFSLFPVVMSIALAAPYFFIAVQSKLPRYFILGGILIFTGVFIMSLNLSLVIAMFATVISSSMIVLFSGCVTFVKFLHDNPLDSDYEGDF